MRHHLRGRLLVAAGAATAVVLAPLPVAAGVSLSTGSNFLADVLPGLTTSATPAPPESSAVATPTPADPAASAPSATAPETSAPADPTPVAPATPTPVSAEAISNGPRDKAQVAITLDADLSEQTLYRINQGSLPAQVNVGVLDYLEATSTPATVFVTGLWAQQYPDVMDRMAANPIYELANHTYDHSAWTTTCYGLPTVQGDPAAQVQLTSSLIAQHTGKPPAFFRFPGLCHDQAHVDFVANLGVRTVDYDLATSDAFAHDPTAVAQSILSQVQNGSIILLHLNGVPNAPYTAEILAQLVPGLQSLGLTPVTMTELMR